MYKELYHLHSKPFSLLPDSECLYLGSTHRTAYSLLEYGLVTEAPFMVLTGDPGTGKTSLLQKLIADTRDAYSIGFLANARYDMNYLLPWILLALGLNHTQLDPVEAQHLFAAFLAQEATRRRRVISSPAGSKRPSAPPATNASRSRLRHLPTTTRSWPW